MGRSVIIAGGGTGGHIYPGVAIARAIQKMNPQIDIHFVGTPSGLETRIIPKEGFVLHTIEVGKLNRSGHIRQKILTLVKLPKAFLESVILLRQLKPEYVLGVGGYASGPFVFVANLLGYRCGIWEPNAYPGMTNRWLSRFVNQAFLVFKDAASFIKSKKIEIVGLPVREAIEKIGHQKVNHETFNILIFGGSQGAHAINEIAQKMILEGGDWLKDVKIIHQTGKQDYQDINNSYQKRLDLNHVQCEEYLHSMDEYYKWADLVICRSGASTVAELAACGKPSILIPLPTAADDHQTKNAESLAHHQAAILLPQKNLTPGLLVEKIVELKNNKSRREQMRDNLLKFYTPNSAETIARLVLS